MRRKIPILCVLAVLGCALCTVWEDRIALAEVDATPLVQMRAAAEALAEVEPESVISPGSKQSLPQIAAAEHQQPPVAKEALRTLMRAAAKAEVARELAPREIASPARAGGGGGPKDPSSGDSAREAAAQARSAAAQAQQARLNRSVSEQRANAKSPKGPAGPRN